MRLVGQIVVAGENVGYDASHENPLFRRCDVLLLL